MDNGREPATKADIEALREQIHDTETKLLTAFYEFAKANIFTPLIIEKVNW